MFNNGSPPSVTRENEIEVDNSNGSNKASFFKCIPIYVIGEPGAKNVHYV